MFDTVKHAQISIYTHYKNNGHIKYNMILTPSEPFPSKPAAASSINNQQNHLNLYILPRTILPDGFFGMESMNSIPPVNHLYRAFESATC